MQIKLDCLLNHSCAAHKFRIKHDNMLLQENNPQQGGAMLPDVKWRTIFNYKNNLIAFIPQQFASDCNFEFINERHIRLFNILMLWRQFSSF